MDDRIRLAEAMGYTKCGLVNEKPWGHYHHEDGSGRGCGILPDPFTDANDDYAVLEWMRETKLIRHENAWQLESGEQWEYQIGDYARAALKVIDG